MRYSVACDRPGRLRVRFGRDAFSAGQSYGIAELLHGIDDVKRVTSAVANGSVLVEYDADGESCREEVLGLFDSLERSALPSAEATDEQHMAEVDARFQTDIVRAVGAHVLRRVLLPAPLRAAWTIWRSIGFLRTGARRLLDGKLTVEVLDATAITASMLQGDFDSAGMVMLLLGISDTLEGYTHARSRMALQTSLALNIDEVWLVTEDGEVGVAADQVRAGDRIRVRTGAMVPVDGTVVDGEAALNEASMTGESRLVVKSAGDTVFAGTVLEEGSLLVEVLSAGADTRISRIVELVDGSEKLKAGVQSRAERLADSIVPYSFLGFFGVLALTRTMAKAVSVLMVDYSCAIKLSTPVAVMSAMREAAARGMVVKGGRYLEVMAAADTIVFDKTGTLTAAQPHVQRVIALADMNEDEVLRLSACLEEHFPHSVARAVVAEAKARGVEHDDELHSEVDYIVAHGIASSVDGRSTVLGSWHFVFEDEGVCAPSGLRERIAAEAPGCSVIYLAVDHEPVGAICVDDPVRPEAAEAVAALRTAGFETIVMLTGDAENAARVAARQLGIDEYRSQVLPEDKADIVEEYKRAGHTVVMVGDGVNDSPALAVADASVAMLDASDIAREVADITLLHSSLDALVTLRTLSERLMRRIEGNYRFIVAFNTALIASGVAGLLQPATSALLHNVSTMGVTAGSMSSLLGADEGNRI